MPIYEYECTKCGVVHEQRYEGFDAPLEIECQACHDVAKKIVSRCDFRLIGDGWPSVNKGKTAGGCYLSGDKCKP